MEPEGLLLCLEEPANIPCPEPDEFISHPPTILPRFNIFIPPTRRSSEWYTPFTLSNQTFA
jgi:hypothetical protein